MQLAVLLVLAALLLGACAQPGSVPAASAEPRTAFDQTDADRRAANRMELASLYYARGQYETALDETKLALAAKPDLGAAFGLRGLIYAAMGEERLADESFQRALAINPRDADAMHNRAWFQCQSRRFDEAERGFEQALAQPQYREQARTLLAQGVCLARAGKLDASEQKLVRAFELDTGNPTVALNLAEVLHRRGQSERARFYIQRVHQRDEWTSAGSLYLALRIERRLGNGPAVDLLAQQLRNRFPQSPESLSIDRGRIDD
ncbi:MAG TPA: type IV pilus biogenesis/stability protein PilW [Burkholderiaceae bacterium]|nr:type IV pilus biogenesis/stability protein PilW [Burkholderiaceae bacterium]